MDEDQKKCGGISAIGIAAILMSLACIVIGAINIDFSASQDFASTCKAEPKIPFYLLVAGVLNIIIIVLRLIFQVIIFHISKFIWLLFFKLCIWNSQKQTSGSCVKKGLHKLRITNSNLKNKQFDFFFWYCSLSIWWINSIRVLLLVYFVHMY